MQRKVDDVPYVCDKPPHMFLKRKDSLTGIRFGEMCLSATNNLVMCIAYLCTSLHIFLYTLLDWILMINSESNRMKLIMSFVDYNTCSVVSMQSEILGSLAQASVWDELLALPLPGWPNLQTITLLYICIACLCMYIPCKFVHYKPTYLHTCTQ